MDQIAGNGTCFMIQPFAEPYNKRYEDVFRLAIVAAGLSPYRVDKDPTVDVPIQDIERGIRQATVCLAEITTDNPNVWFELGYAFAVNPQICLVCSEERKTKYPFDIQHRAIIGYKNESASDFSLLQKQITERLMALAQTKVKLQSLGQLDQNIRTNGLSPHEQAVLIAIMKNLYSTASLSGHAINQDLENAGFNQLATSIAVRLLLTKGMILPSKDRDYDGTEFDTYALSEQGLEWIVANQDKFILRSPKQQKPTDEIPF